MISFVGAGPGAPDLITLRGADRLRRAEVVIWASSLVPAAVLEHVGSGASLHDSAVMTLEDVLEVFEEHPFKRVVRLHSGDPAIYGAIQEQIDWCVAMERDFEIVPGVSSLAAAAAALRRELTLPGVAQSIVLTRTPGRTAASMRPTESISSFAGHGVTMAVFLSAARPRELQQQLLAAESNYGPDTPAAIVAHASWPDQQVAVTTVGKLAGEILAMGATTTVLVLVGHFLAPSSSEQPFSAGFTRDAGSVDRVASQRSHLYSPGFAHAHRRRSSPGSTKGRRAR